eukprot:Protomagalhaensia_wolfi_Nauph_80__2457@NODE_262_length_3030_cov_9_424607_g196_i0_p2_GENE_NODE_262_length_3030_cov_9_424607_g196_i0NODE_262_length_3030_cov_9_424607_g196_i0_p2_ORF_typecomplete_len304_score66_30RMI1_C/PF16099_5/0_029RMI1_C/PF16099_5/4_3e03FAM176/PF14851_6/2_4FAM176/PF14851_6/6_3DUF2201_N/PF13203_6/6_8_NODE_262_length_3030_cov_9_424607_g196_i020822993
MDTRHLVLAVLVCTALLIVLVYRFWNFLVVRRQWQGVKVKTPQSLAPAPVKKKRKKTKKSKPKGPEPVIIISDSPDDRAASKERKQRQDAELTHSQIAKIKDTSSKLLVQYNQYCQKASKLRLERKKRIMAGNSFAARFDISDSEAESELDVSEVSLTEVVGFITEEIDRVKAEIAELEQSLSPPPPTHKPKLSSKQLIKKKEPKTSHIDNDGWQTINSKKKGDIEQSDGPRVLGVGTRKDKEISDQESDRSQDSEPKMETQDKPEISAEEAARKKALKRKRRAQRKKEKNGEPPIPGLVYVK